MRATVKATSQLGDPVASDRHKGASLSAGFATSQEAVYPYGQAGLVAHLFVGCSWITFMGFTLANQATTDCMLRNWDIELFQQRGY